MGPFCKWTYSVSENSVGTVKKPRKWKTVSQSSKIFFPLMEHFPQDPCMVYGKYTIHGSHGVWVLVIIRCCFCSTSTRWWWIYSQRKPCDHGIFGRKVPWIFSRFRWVGWRNCETLHLFAHEGVLVVSGSWSDMLKEHLEKGHWVHIILCCILNYVWMCIIQLFNIVYVVLFYTISYCNECAVKHDVILWFLYYLRLYSIFNQFSMTKRNRWEEYLRERITPTNLFCGWDWDHQSYSRNGG